MFFEVLVAWAISIGALLGLFHLTGQVVQINDNVLRLSITTAQLRGIEGHWRLARYDGVHWGEGQPLCSADSDVLPGWCQGWQELMVSLGGSGTVHLERESGEFVANAVLHFHSADGPGDYRLSHSWPGP